MERRPDTIPSLTVSEEMLVIELKWKNKDGMMKILKWRTEWRFRQVNRQDRVEERQTSVALKHEWLQSIQPNAESQLHKAAGVPGLSGRDGGIREPHHHHHPRSGGGKIQREETPADFLNSW